MSNTCCSIIFSISQLMMENSLSGKSFLMAQLYDPHETSVGLDSSYKEQI